ncbi:hypothetical protein M422DRAFT_251174 [Sphaerobolus stellatus SS14]|uniref:Uncharacterized protein n=1 Tax=Sphaerobolus stellatus (strain SS14) TaxID=990650 RepID=A0A0C9VEF1_SPHS4|nr:hypothetical protein M422DRAFT_251174 [Sphaerobolus stellatus SS14]
MTNSKESQSKRSRNAAELLACFREKQAQRDENRVEVSAVHGACFRPARFSFSKDEILDGIHGAWPHISEYIRGLDISRATLEKELDLEKTDNRQSLQPKPPTGDQSITAASATDIPSSDVSPHPLWSPGDRTYSRKGSRKLFENPSLQNRVMVPEKRPDYWLLYMWNAVKEWHTNPMSVPNALRDDTKGYFLKEDIDVATWISKVSADISRPAFMEQMKVVFGSRDNFDMAFSGFATNLLKPDHEATMWITNSSTPLRIGTHIVMGWPPKSQDTKPEKLPTRPDFLALSRISAHALTPVKTGESSRQRLDEDLDSYNQVREPVLPYEEEPPSGEPETGNTVPPSEGAKVTLTDESHMDVDPELDNIYS